MRLVYKNTEIDKKSYDFIKKINYVIGAIQAEISNLPVSPWKVRHEQLRINAFEKLKERTAIKSFVKQGFVFDCKANPSALPQHPMHDFLICLLQK